MDTSKIDWLAIIEGVGLLITLLMLWGKVSTLAFKVDVMWNTWMKHAENRAEDAGLKGGTFQIMSNVNTSWQTTIGGAFSALGVTLMGVGIVPQLGNGAVANPTLTKIALAGFICSAIGTFFSHLFAASVQAVNAQVANLQAQVDTKTQTPGTTTVEPLTPTPTKIP